MNLILSGAAVHRCDEWVASDGGLWPLSEGAHMTLYSFTADP